MDQEENILIWSFLASILFGLTSACWSPLLLLYKSNGIVHSWALIAASLQKNVIFSLKKYGGSEM